MLYIDHNCDDEEDIITDVTEHLYNVISRKFPAEVSMGVRVKLMNVLVRPSKKPKFSKR